MPARDIIVIGASLGGSRRSQRWSASCRRRFASFSTRRRGLRDCSQRSCPSTQETFSFGGIIATIGRELTQESEHSTRPSVDIVPFGDIEDEKHAVRWPPDMEFEISVLGCKEALQMTEAVIIDEVEIRVVSASLHPSLAGSLVSAV